MTRKLIAGIVLSAVGLLVARRVVATATTTTTLPPSATFSPATTACLKEAATQQKMCNMTSSVASCQTEFDTALASCFAPGKGVSCAAACAAKRTKCTAAAASTVDKQCTKSCQNGWVAAGAQCGSDQACLAAARVDYAACCVAKKTKCAGAVVPGANKSCPSGCQNSWINAGSQCSGVPSCYTAALAAYNACKLACAGVPVVSCQAAFTACIAKCPNL